MKIDRHSKQNFRRTEQIADQIFLMLSKIDNPIGHLEKLMEIAADR